MNPQPPIKRPSPMTRRGFLTLMLVGASSVVVAKAGESATHKPRSHSQPSMNLTPILRHTRPAIADYEESRVLWVDRSLPSDYRARLVITPSGALEVVDDAPAALAPPPGLNYRVYGEKRKRRQALLEWSAVAARYPALSHEDYQQARAALRRVRQLGEDPQALMAYLSHSPLSTPLAPDAVRQYFSADALGQVAAMTNSLHEGGLPTRYDELVSSGAYDLGAYAELDPTLRLLATPDNASRTFRESALTTENLINPHYPPWSLQANHPVVQNRGEGGGLVHGILNTYAIRLLVLGTGVLASHSFFRYHGEGEDFYTRILWDQVNAMKQIMLECRARGVLPVWLIPQVLYRAEDWNIYISRDALTLRDITQELCRRYGGLALDVYNSGGRLCRLSQAYFGIDPYRLEINNRQEMHTSVYGDNVRWLVGLDFRREVAYGSAVFDVGFLQVFDLLQRWSTAQMGAGEKG